ncbi:MAG TPA: RagB/SusD family nutrient uptake outer membrane protein [Gemmatimonadaceae bacterium]|jgi:hypothetical protein
MKARLIGSVIAATLLLGACDNVLSTTPYDAVPASTEIVDAATAQAALNGAYDAEQGTGVYGLDLEVLSALASGNAVWTGTLQFLGDVATNHVAADNSEVTNMWTGLYRQLDRDNTVIAKTTLLTNIAPATKNEILGEAYFLRALTLHNLVKYWGAIPMPLVPVTVATDAAAYTRTPVDQVYTQILADLDSAGNLVTNTSNTRLATVAAVHAIRARVLFYRASQNGATSAADFQAALDEANTVLSGRDTLTVSYPDLFSAAGINTSEDIFRISFTASERNNIGYYYLYAGRNEAGASPGIVAAYEPGDVRKAWSVALRPGSTTIYQTTKFPTSVGTEHPHVIRLAEVMLIKAEVLARQGNLAGAVAEYNKIRARAGLRAHVLGLDVKTYADVQAAIDKERRLELAFEGDYWSDLNREGRAAVTKGFTDRAYEALMPIPLHDMTTSPGLVQNPGYATP